MFDTKNGNAFHCPPNPLSFPKNGERVSLLAKPAVLPKKRKCVSLPAKPAVLPKKRRAFASGKKRRNARKALKKPIRFF